MRKRSQNTEIRNYLSKNDHITPWVAMGVFKIMRLASRIDEIRTDLFMAGDEFRIHTEMVSDARAARYARYRLVNRHDVRFHDMEACHVLVKEAA